MSAANFEIVRSSDREMLEALKAMHADGAVQCQKFIFTFLSEGQVEVVGDGISSNEQLESLAGENVRVFRNVKIETPLGHIAVKRHDDSNGDKDNTKPFDKVAVNPVNRQQPEPLQLARLVAFAQKHL